MAFWDTPQLLSGSNATETGGSPKPRLAIGILHTHTVDLRWAMRWGLVTAQLQKKNTSFSFIPSANQPYDTSREMIARIAIDSGAKYLFFLDSDVLIPVNAPELLMEWSERFNLPVISGLYWAKKPGEPMPAAWFEAKFYEKENRYDFAPMDLKRMVERATGKNPIFPVDVCGTGCMMINIEIFRKLQESNPELPFFQWGIGRYNYCPKCKYKEPLPWMSEDFYFCLRIRKELNISPHIATAIKCDHVSTCVRRAEDGQFELSVGLV